ncbi:unnamed protein product, partial [Closterium sp. Yama58-4]
MTSGLVTTCGKSFASVAGSTGVTVTRTNPHSPLDSFRDNHRTNAPHAEAAPPPRLLRCCRDAQVARVARHIRGREGDRLEQQHVRAALRASLEMLCRPIAAEALVSRALTVSHTAPASRHTARMPRPLAAFAAALSLPLAPRASPTLHLLPSRTAHSVTSLPCAHTQHNQHAKHTQHAGSRHFSRTQHTQQCRSSNHVFVPLSPSATGVPPSIYQAHAGRVSAIRSPLHTICAATSRQRGGMAGTAADAAAGGAADAAAGGAAAEQPAGPSGVDGTERTTAQGATEGGATGAPGTSGEGEGALQGGGEGQGQAQGDGEGGEAGGAGEEEDPLVQHVVIRRDLIEALQWPLGSVITQGCHASVAVLWQHRHHPNVLKYCGQLDSMRKVTLEVKGEVQLLNLSKKLQEAGITHRVWMEQPENMPTCIATLPHPKNVVAPHMRKLKLWMLQTPKSTGAMACSPPRCTAFLKGAISVYPPPPRVISSPLQRARLSLAKGNDDILWLEFFRSQTHQQPSRIVARTFVRCDVARQGSSRRQSQQSVSAGATARGKTARSPAGATTAERLRVRKEGSAPRKAEAPAPGAGRAKGELDAFETWLCGGEAHRESAKWEKDGGGRGAGRPRGGSAQPAAAPTPTAPQ